MVAYSTMGSLQPITDELHEGQPFESQGLYHIYRQALSVYTMCITVCKNHYFHYYAPNFKEVDWAYWFWVVRLASITLFEACHNL